MTCKTVWEDEDVCDGCVHAVIMTQRWAVIGWGDRWHHFTACKPISHIWVKYGRLCLPSPCFLSKNVAQDWTELCPAGESLKVKSQQVSIWELTEEVLGLGWRHLTLLQMIYDRLSSSGTVDRSHTASFECHYGHSGENETRMKNLYYSSPCTLRCHICTTSDLLHITID